MTPQETPLSAFVQSHDPKLTNVFEMVCGFGAQEKAEQGFRQVEHTVAEVYAMLTKVLQEEQQYSPIYAFIKENPELSGLFARVQYLIEQKEIDNVYREVHKTVDGVRFGLEELLKTGKRKVRKKKTKKETCEIGSIFMFVEHEAPLLKNLLSEVLALGHDEEVLESRFKRLPITSIGAVEALLKIFKDVPPKKNKRKPQKPKRKANIKTMKTQKSPITDLEALKGHPFNKYFKASNVSQFRENLSSFMYDHEDFILTNKQVEVLLYNLDLWKHSIKNLHKKSDDYKIIKTHLMYIKDEFLEKKEHKQKLRQWMEGVFGKEEEWIDPVAGNGDDTSDWGEIPTEFTTGGYNQPSNTEEYEKQQEEHRQQLGKEWNDFLLLAEEENESSIDLAKGFLALMKSFEEKEVLLDDMIEHDISLDHVKELFVTGVFASKMKSFKRHQLNLYQTYIIGGMRKIKTLYQDVRTFEGSGDEVQSLIDFLEQIESEN